MTISNSFLAHKPSVIPTAKEGFENQDKLKKNNNKKTQDKQQQKTRINFKKTPKKPQDKLYTRCP